MKPLLILAALLMIGCNTETIVYKDRVIHDTLYVHDTVIVKLSPKYNNVFGDVKTVNIGSNQKIER